MTQLSPAQKRALEWLPSDGTWRRDQDLQQEIDLQDLIFMEPPLAERQWVQSDDRTWGYRFALTPAGIALKAEMEADRG